MPPAKLDYNALRTVSTTTAEADPSAPNPARVTRPPSNTIQAVEAPGDYFSHQGAFSSGDTSQNDQAQLRNLGPHETPQRAQFPRPQSPQASRSATPLPRVPPKPIHLRSGSANRASKFSEKALSIASKKGEATVAALASIHEASFGALEQMPLTETASAKSPANGLQALKDIIKSCEDLGRDSRFIKGSSGMNKTLYSLDRDNVSNRSLPHQSFAWVLLVATAGIENSKWRAQEAEISILKTLHGQGISIPKTDFNLMTTDLNGNKARLFLQERLNIIAELGKDEQKFLQALSRVGLSSGRKKETADAIALRSQIKNIWRYLQNNDIHDFQACISRDQNQSERLVVIDPGDPSLSSSYPDKHRLWVKNMAKAVGLTIDDLSAI